MSQRLDGKMREWATGEKNPSSLVKNKNKNIYLSPQKKIVIQYDKKSCAYSIDYLSNAPSFSITIMD
jgi:hypothetical protein